MVDGVARQRKLTSQLQVGLFETPASLRPKAQARGRAGARARELGREAPPFGVARRGTLPGLEARL